MAYLHRNRFRFLWTVVIATSLTWSGCKSTSPSGTTTTFQGTLAGPAGQIGTLTMTVQTVVASSTALASPFVATLHAASVNADGTLRLKGGAVIALTGTYDSATKALSLSGGGYAFTGTISGDSIAGGWTGPNNTSGRFSGLNATSSTVTAYCGTFTSTLNETGVWDFETSTSGSVAGFSQVAGKAEGFCPFSGQLTGANLALTNCENTKINGTLQGSSASGSGTASDGSVLTFTASTAGCQ